MEETMTDEFGVPFLDDEGIEKKTYITKQADFMGIARTDSYHEFMTTRDGRYEPFQNEQVLELAMMVGEMAGREVKKIQSVGKNGELMYVSLEGRKFEIGGNAKVGDIVEERFNISNSHDGSRSLSLSFGHVVLSCTNGMTRFDKKASISIRHTANMKKKLEQMLSGWSSVALESQKMVEGYEKMMDKKVGEKEMKHIFKLVAGVDPQEDIRNLSTRKTNIITDLRNSVVTEMSYKGQTAWGLFNGVTHFTTKKSSTVSGLKSKIFGGSQQKDFTVWNYLMSL